jgi:hypothetical protein
MDPLLTGYKAAGYMVMANHLFNPVTKLSFFKKGRLLLENAVAADTSDIELRFIRYSIQTHCPSFLGYKRSILEDRRMLLQYIKTTPNNSLRVMIVHYMQPATDKPQQQPTPSPRISSQSKPVKICLLQLTGLIRMPCNNPIIDDRIQHVRHLISIIGLFKITLNAEVICLVYVRA